VGTFEIGCGLLVLLGLPTRLAALTLIAVMLVAISTTKVPILLIVGAGPWSVDGALGRRQAAGD